MDVLATLRRQPSPNLFPIENRLSPIPFAASSSHSASVGSLAITLEELMPHRTTYAQQVIANARSLGAQLASRGFDVAGKEFGYSHTHQVWVHLPDGHTTHQWGRILTAANIRSTTVRLPSTGRPGLRLGTQELTRWGMRENDMGVVADLLARLLLGGEAAEEIAEDVAILALSYPGVAFAGPLASLASR